MDHLENAIAASRDQLRDPLLTPDRVAKRLDVHVETVYRWMRSGKLAWEPAGERLKRIRTSALEQFLGRQPAVERDQCSTCHD